MVSGIGFKNTADEEQQGAPRKHTISHALLVAFGVLVIVVVIYGALKMWESSLKKEATSLDQQIKDVEAQILENLSGETADFAVRLETFEDELYRGYDTNDIFTEIENIMIPRVVLKDFQHNSGAEERRPVAGNTTTTVTGRGTITISADADNFDVMAQQIEVFKKSPFFDNVTVGTTDRDDAGRIIFTLSMDVNPSKESPYDQDATVAATEAFPMTTESTEDIAEAVPVATPETEGSNQ